MTDLRKAAEMALELAERQRDAREPWGMDELRAACVALRAALAQPADVEPVADTFVLTVPDKCDRIVWRGSYFHLPIANPPARVPLTDEEIEDVWNFLVAKYIEDVDHAYWSRCDFEFARAIEAAHGIGGGK